MNPETSPCLAFASRHPWAVRAALAVGALALVATSPPPSYEFTFRGEPIAFATELTPETPTRVYRITLRAEALGPSRVQTTSNPSATIHGSITFAGLDQGAKAPFVAFDAFDPDATTPHAPVNALTEIFASSAVKFDGDCRTFDPGNPCVATLVVELSRTDDGASGGLVNVPWTLELTSRVSKPDSPNVGPLDLPWNVTVEEM